MTTFSRLSLLGTVLLENLLFSADSPTTLSRKVTSRLSESTSASSTCSISRSLTVEGNVVKLQIWDTAGQERFRTITGAYYKGAHAILIVYDITKAESFEDIDKFWMGEVSTVLFRSKSLRNPTYTKSLSETRLTMKSDDKSKFRTLLATASSIRSSIYKPVPKAGKMFPSFSNRSPNS